MDTRLVELLSQLQTQLERGLPGLFALFAEWVISRSPGRQCRDRTPILMTVRGWAIGPTAIVLPFFGIERPVGVFVGVTLLAELGVFALAGRESIARADPFSRDWSTPRASRLYRAVDTLGRVHALASQRAISGPTECLSAAPLPPGFFSPHPTYPPALALRVWLGSQLPASSRPAQRALTTMLIVLSVALVVRLASGTMLRTMGPDASPPSADGGRKRCSRSGQSYY
jgi:hypothetical protein